MRKLYLSVYSFAAQCTLYFAFQKTKGKTGTRRAPIKACEIEEVPPFGSCILQEELSTFRPILEQEPNLSTDSNAVLYGNVEESTLPKIL